MELQKFLYRKRKRKTTILAGDKSSNIFASFNLSMSIILCMAFASDKTVEKIFEIGSLASTNKHKVILL